MVPRTVGSPSAFARYHHIRNERSLSYLLLYSLPSAFIFPSRAPLAAQGDCRSVAAT
jgi:hypothetical protein